MYIRQNAMDALVGSVIFIVRPDGSFAPKSRCGSASVFASRELNPQDQLYKFVVGILLIAMKYNSGISLENHYRSWFWAAILALAQTQKQP